MSSSDVLLIPNGPAPATIEPSIPFTLHLALTIVYLSIYSALFLFVYIQLWMILYYRHKRRSYQTVFLFLCLIWAGLRISLFSFYLKPTSMEACDALNVFWYWLLYSCPVVLQFTTLVLLVAFFSQVIIRARHPERASVYKRIVRMLCTSAVVVYSAVNVVCGVLAHRQPDSDISYQLLVVRVSVNGTLFLIFGVALSYWIYALNRIANARTILESRGTTMVRAWLTCIFICFLFASRAIYNIAALVLHHQIPNFGFGWVNVTDQADLVNLYDGYNYLAYGVILFLWEILPTFIVTVFFRVQRPTNLGAEQSLDEINRQNRYVFDNPPARQTTASIQNAGPGLAGSERNVSQSFKKDSRRNLWKNSASRSPQYNGT